MGKIHPKLGQTNWMPGTIFSTAAHRSRLGILRPVRAPCATSGPCSASANQMLAVIALAVISSYLANEGRAKYLWVTVIPMLVVATTTTTAAAEMLANLLGNTLLPQLQNPHPFGSNAFWAIVHAGSQAGLIVAMLICGTIIVISSAMRIWTVTSTRDLRPSELLNPV